MLLLAGILTIAFIFTLSITPLAIAMAHRIGYLDKPSDRKIHVVPTPLLGGAAVLLGFALSFGFAYSIMKFSSGGIFTGYIAGAVMIVIIGLIDDGLGMSPGSKMFGQVLTAVLFLTFSRAGGILMNTPLDFTIAILWMITLMNALNFLDNMDGLCSGISFCAALGFSVLGLNSGEPFLVITGAALMGTLAGFLFFNLNPAKIFLGDAGSMFLGYTLASLGVVFAISHPHPQHLLTPLLIMSYPLFDISFVTFNRLREGRSLAQGGKDHTSHRLVNLGIRSSRAVWSIFIICFLLAALGNILFLSTDSSWNLITVTIVAFLLLILGIHLSRNFANIKEKTVLIISDAVGVNLTFLAFYYLRFTSGIFNPPAAIPIDEFVPAAIWITFYWLFIFGILGQYDFSWDRFYRVEIIKLIKAVIAGIGIFIILSMDFSTSNWAWLLHLVSYGLLMIIIIGSIRGLILYILGYYYSHGFSMRKTIIIGSPRTAGWFEKVLSEKPEWAIEIVGRVSNDPEDIKALGSIEDLSRLIRRYHVSEVIILEPGSGKAAIHDIIRLGSLMEINFKIFPELKNYIRGLKTEKMYRTGMLNIYPDRMRVWEWGFKRVVDLVISMIMVIISIPIFLLSALIIKINIGGTVLVHRNYIGQGKEIIRFPKFRVSRSENSDETQDTFKESINSFWGKFLRTSGIEKLPMLFSVLYGKLSLVGPAPDTLEKGEQLVLKHPLYNRRWAIKPGLLSFASVAGKIPDNHEYSQESLDLDLKYLEHMSMLTDAKIFLASLLKIWTRKLS